MSRFWDEKISRVDRSPNWKQNREDFDNFKINKEQFYKRMDNITTEQIPDEKLNLDLAAGQNKREGFKGVDEWPGSDIVWDLFKFPYPFEDNSVDEIHCSHFIEHIPMEYIEVNGRRKDMLFAFVDEVHRILKPGAKATLIFPCATSTRAFQDPTHRRFIPEQTAYYFTKWWRDANKLDHYNAECDFDFVTGQVINSNWQTRHQDARTFAYQHYWNVVDDLHFILTKKVIPAK